MLRNRSVANAGWIIGCRVVQALLGLVISMLTARYLGPSGFGVINYAAALVAFVTPIANLGLSHIVVQEIVYSPESEDKILGSSMLMSFCSSILCILGIVAFSFLTDPEDPQTTLVCGLYSLLLIAQALEVIQYWFQANLISKYTSVVSVLAYVLISIYKAVLLFMGKSVYWFAVANAIDHILIGIVLAILYKRLTHRRLSFSREWAWRIFNKSKHFILSGMMVTIFAQTDKIMLKFMLGEEAVGLYSAATTCVGVTSFVFVAIIDSMRPAILENKKKESPLYERDMSCLYAIIIYMALAQSILMTLLAKPVMLIMNGKKYVDAVMALRIVVWYTTFSYVGSVRNVWILAEKKQKYLWCLNLSGALLNVLLNLCLIPLWGIEGAAVASVITQFFTNFILGFIMPPIRPNNRLLLRGFLPGTLWDVVKYVVPKRWQRGDRPPRS